MPKFQADFSAYGTIYVDAPDAEAARAKMKEHVNKNVSIDFPDDLKLDDGSMISAAWSGIQLENEVEEADGVEEETPEPQEFTVRAMVTARVAGYATVTALTHDEACDKALRLDNGDFEFRVDEDFCIDGDPIYFVSDQEFDTEATELDPRPVGEPYSWDCVHLVKELAKILDLPWERDRNSAAVDLAKKAKALLKQPETTI